MEKWQVSCCSGAHDPRPEHSRRTCLALVDDPFFRHPPRPRLYSHLTCIGPIARPACLRFFFTDRAVATCLGSRPGLSPLSPLPLLGPGFLSLCARHTRPQLYSPAFHSCWPCLPKRTVIGLTVAGLPANHPRFPHSLFNPFIADKCSYALAYPIP